MRWLVGNVVLKFAEGLADALFGMMKEEFGPRFLQHGALLLKPGLRRIKRRWIIRVWRRTLLGVNGVVILFMVINAKAICNAIRVAEKCKAEYRAGIAEDAT